MSTKSIIRANKVDVKQHLDMLFALESKIVTATPTLLQLQIESKDRFFKFLTEEPNSTTWLWKDQGGKPVGYLTLVDKPHEEEIYVLAIRVLPEVQDKGYGRQMMDFAEKLAVKLGRKKITLLSNPRNAKAVGFYKHLGYEIAKEIPNYFGDGEARYLLEKSLA